MTEQLLGMYSLHQFCYLSQLKLPN